MKRSSLSFPTRQIIRLSCYTSADWPLVHTGTPWLFRPSASSSNIHANNVRYGSSRRHISAEMAVGLVNQSPLSYLLPNHPRLFSWDRLLSLKAVNVKKTFLFWWTAAWTVVPPPPMSTPYCMRPTHGTHTHCSGAIQTINHTHCIESCPLTRFTGGDSFRLHSTDNCAITRGCAERCNESLKRMRPFRHISHSACI